MIWNIIRKTEKKNLVFFFIEVFIIIDIINNRIFLGFCSILN